MSDTKKIIAPFTISSSLTQGGYLTDLQSKFQSGVEIINYHEDKIGEIENDPMQSPFTQQWVGGNSHRHIDLNNDGTDRANNRQEAWHLIPNQASIRLYSHRFLNSPPAYWTREEGAKRPVNIKNILTTTASVNHGNFRINYEIVHTVGRFTNSFLKNILTGSENAGSLRTRFVSGSNVLFDNTRRSQATLDAQRNKTVIVSRFNAPGEVNTSTRASLDVESEEISPNISLTFRNMKIRNSLRSLLSQSQSQFNLNNAINGVNRNSLPSVTGKVNKDNFFVQHMIPRTDIQYAWITSSTSTKAIDLGGYESFNGSYNRSEAFSNIVFAGETSDLVIRKNKKEFDINTATNTVGPVSKIKLAQYTSNAFPTGNVDGQDFSLTTRAAIRIDANTNVPYLILNGGPAANSVGTVYLETRFTTPIRLSIVAIDGNRLSIGNNDPLEASDFLQVDISLDDKNSWSSYATLMNGNKLTTEKIYTTEISQPSPFYVRLGAQCATSETIAIRDIQAYPISQSFNDYSFSSWKETRGYENVVARKLRDSNLISVSDTSPEKTRQLGGRQIVSAKRSDAVSNFSEPLVSSKYRPLKHVFIFKGNTNPHLAHEVIHTYNNNLSMFANKGLNNKLGISENRDQVYNRLLEMYSDPHKSEDDNPIAKFISYNLSEVIYPKEENTGLKKTRNRQKYILNKPGFDRDGYDRQYGTQRVFWRDSYYDRMRSASGSFNSQKQFVGLMPLTATFHDNFGGAYAGYEGPYSYNSYMSASYFNKGQNSVLPIEYLSNINLILTASLINTGTSGTGVFTSSQKVNAFENAGELNNFTWIDTYAMFAGNFGAGGGSAQLIRNSIQSLFLLQTYARITNLQQQPGGVAAANSGNGLPYTWYFENSSSVFPQPSIKYCAFLGGYENGTRTAVDPFSAQPTGKLTSSLDFGIRYVADQMSGKKPWFDSYEKYVDDIRGLTKSYSILPEFRISEHLNFYVSQSGGNFRATNNAFLTIDGIDSEYRSALAENALSSNNFFKTYINSDTVKNVDEIRKQNKNITNLNKISFKVSGIKKLLPYNGFYPINRTVQLANLYSDYINAAFHGGYLITPKQFIGMPSTQTFVIDTPLAQAAYKQSALEPLFSPGILFNTIKSGIAVDWPAVTASFRTNGSYTALDYPQFSYVDTTVPLSYRPFISLRIPFEAILDPSLGFATKPKLTSSSDLNDVTTLSVQNNLRDTYLMGHFDTSTHSFIQQGNNDQDYVGSVPFTYITKNNKPAPLYQMSMNNFLAETVHFFLQDEKMNAFISKEESKWKIFDASKIYYMDLVLRKDPALVMMEAFTSSYTLASKTDPTVPAITNTMHGRYFGYPVDMVGNTSINRTYNMHHDPAFAPYTPPYFEGEAIYRISFAPTTTQKYTLDQIFQQATVSNIFTELSQKVHTGSVAFRNKMSVESSINAFGVTRLNEVEFEPARLFKPSNVKQSTDSTRNAWVIGPKMETPVLDFSSQPLAQLIGSHWLGAGFGRGMWSGYGQIPTGSKGIYFELRESFPMQLQQGGTRSGSLLQQVGFAPQSKKVGQLANSKEISEAILVLPYLDYEIPNVTTNINGQNFIKIRKDVFDVQKQNIDNGHAAIKVGNFGSKEEIQETSISQMISSMKNYVIPPQFNFLQYSDIEPFIMYMFEFKHTLSQQDLSDIWQGLMPQIATTAELDEIEITHNSGHFEFFHGRELPENLRWMVFKVKKQAEKNYFAVTSDATDDDRFKFDFQVGRKEPEYSYNWPYDYFSLVEFAKVELSLDYKNKETEDKLVQNQSANFTKNLLNQTKKKRGRKVK